MAERLTGPSSNGKDAADSGFIQGYRPVCDLSGNVSSTLAGSDTPTQPAADAAEVKRAT